MTKKVKRLLLAIALVACLGGIGLNVLAYRHAYAMMHFTSGSRRTQAPEVLTWEEKVGILLSGVSIPRPKTAASLADLSPVAQSLQFECGNRIKLGAWYSAAPGESPLVLLFHGYTGEKSGTVPEARLFLEMGLSVLLVDFRGSGESSEDYTTVGYAEAEDVAAAVRYARAKLPHRQIILYGQSMGAAAILRAIHSGGVQPDAIIVEAVFDNMVNTVRNRFRLMRVPSFPGAELLVFWGGLQAGFNGFSHNPVDYARAVKCPTLFLHGGADPRARVEEALRVFEVVTARKRFQEFPGIGHHPPAIRYPDEWKKVVGEFLEAESLSSGGAN